MQALWLIFDDMAGKGVTVAILGKYLFYVSVMTVPQAIPIAVLLASIMTLGNFSENYEFAATKSTGISLQRLLTPLFILVIGFSAVNLVFLNNLFPWAVMKQTNLLKNIKKQKPALALIEGTFNTEIPNYIIKFDKKYGKEENLLKNVLIYHKKSYNKLNSITAKKGIIAAEQDSRYMSLQLEDGYLYEDHWSNNNKKAARRRMPFSKTHFDTYTVNIDISSFNKEGLEEIKLKHTRGMLSFNQLNIFSDSLKTNYDKYVYNKANNIKNRIKTNHLYAQKDSIDKYSIVSPILSNFDTKSQVQITESAVNSLERSLKAITNKQGYKNRRKQLNLIDTEYHRRIALSFSALLLFMIGAPLGSLIKKGGFGLPMVIAIIIYLIYHFSSEFAKNMAEESTITHIMGGWLSTMIFLPFAILLTYRAARDKSFISMDPILNPIRKLFLFLKRTRLKTTKKNSI